MLLGDPESAAISLSSSSTSSDSSVHLNSLLCSISVLNDKVNQLQSMVAVTASSSTSSCSAALAGSMANLIQQIMVTSSTMVFNCQQIALLPPASATGNDNTLPDIYSHDHMQDEPNMYWYNETYNSTNSNGEVITEALVRSGSPFIQTEKIVVAPGKMEAVNYDLIELDAADLVAKYTHYCQVCAKGFKRDANLRMHMRAHGDEYKSNAALSNPVKSTSTSTMNEVVRKYSCPKEGCRWNKKHEKFQPLKSMICAKNHYRRSHCPKMYLCKRCNTKQFSVLSDLRTHEKHCGDHLKWLCSCGTTFSRKDKLMGHVALFVGHAPAVLANSSAGT